MTCHEAVPGPVRLFRHFPAALTPEAPSCSLWRRKPKTLVSYLQYPFIETVTLDELDLGTFPHVHHGGQSLRHLWDDKVIMEVPVCWGSNCK